MRFLALVILLLPSVAMAQQNCGRTSEVAPSLEKSHGEKSVVRMMSGRLGIVEIFVNRQTGSYTVVVHRPEGISCLIDAGDSFEGVGDKPRPFSEPGDRPKS